MNTLVYNAGLIFLIYKLPHINLKKGVNFLAFKREKYFVVLTKIIFIALEK